MMGMEMKPEMMKAIWSRREVRGMRETFAMSVMGLMTVMRVLPEDLYKQVMLDDDDVAKGSIFEEIVRRFGAPEKYTAPS